jgi:trigger factor
MQVQVENTAGLERKLTLEIPAEQIDTEVQKRVVDTAKRARIDGFRPGKVPRKVVKQRYGEQLRAEVVSEVANRSIQDAMTQESLRPVGSPSVDLVKNEEGQNLELTATFEIFPEIELADVSTLTLEKFTAAVNDTDVEAMIDKLRDQRAQWSEVKRAAEDGDQLNIDYAGKKDGEAFAGGSAEGTDLVLGSGQMIEGFESGLVGATAGEARTLSLVFPEDYQSEDLAGAAVEFDITVNAVSAKELPELNEEFFATFEVDTGLEEFKTKVRENMERQLADSIESHLKQQVMDGLVEQNEFEIPAALIADEIEAMRDQSIERFGAGADFDRSLLPDEMFAEQAQKRVALGVIVSQAVQQYEVKPDREQLIAFIDDIAESYDDPDEVRNLYLSDESRMQQVGLMVTEKLVVEKIVELAGIAEKAGSYDEVIQAAGGQ